MHAQGLAEAILRFLKATWFDAVMPLATVAAAFFAWKSWQVGDKSFRLQKAKADKQPNIVVSMAPQAWVDHGPAMKLGNYGNYQTGGKYPLRIYINNTGTLQADNYRISLYLPKGIGFDPIDRPYGNLPSMKPGAGPPTGGKTTTRFGRTPHSDIGRRGSSPRHFKLLNPHSYRLRKMPPQVTNEKYLRGKERSYAFEFYLA